MAKGGSTQSDVTVPKFFETALQQSVGMGRDVAQTGYVPYYGPDVAAFSPMQQAAFEGTNQMASAFGMPTADNQSYMPQAETFAGGVQGYSAAPIYQESVDALAANRPAQKAYIDSFSIDPVTGAAGSRGPSSQPVALEMQGASRRGK